MGFGEVIVTFFLFTLGMVCLAVYVAMLYAGARHLGRNDAFRKNRIWVFVILGLVSLVPTAIIVAIPMDGILKTTFGFCAWLLHAQPSMLGYWNGISEARIKDETRWKDNADEWIREWEYRDIRLMGDDQEHEADQ